MAVVALLLPALVVGASTLIASVHYLRPGPGFDFWGNAMPFLQAAVDGPWSWFLFWEVGGSGHSLVVPRLLFLAEWHWGGFRNLGLLAVAWLALLGSGLLILRVVWRDARLDTGSRLLSVFLVLLLLGSGHHMNNLAYSFNMQWTVGLFLALSCITAVIQVRDSDRPCGWVWIAVLTAVLLVFTTFSLPALLMAWLMLAWCLRIRRSVCLGVAALLLIALLVYAWHMPWLHGIQWHGTDTGSPGLSDLWHLLLPAIGLFILVYLGSPVSEYSLWAGACLAVMALAYLGLQVIRSRASSLSSREQALLWLAAGYGAFALGMAASTALGRVVFFDLAYSPRFRTLVLPFLLLILLVLVARMQHWPGQLRGLASIMLVTVVTGLVVPGHIGQIKEFSNEYDLFMPPHVAMAVGLSDPAVVHESVRPANWPEDNARMMQYRDFLRDHRRGIFATPLFAQLGTSLTLPVSQLVEQPEAAVSLPGGGYRWQGVTEHCGSDGRVAIVDQIGTVVGSGFVYRGRSEDSLQMMYRVFLPLCRLGYPRHWQAFLTKSVAPGESVTAVVFDRGAVMPIARATTAL